MKLKDALEMGYDCGLETVEEAIINIELHASNLFPYQDIAKELDELYNEVQGINNNAHIIDVLNGGVPKW